MKRVLIVLCITLLSSLAFAQCTTVTQSLGTATLTDTNQHNSLGHSAATGIFDIANPGGAVQSSSDVVGTCTYTDPGGGAVNCSTQCSVALNASTSTSERGTLNATGSHEVFRNWVSGQAGAVGGGTSCTGAFGGGTANCGPGGCQSSVGLSVTVSGQNANASLSGLAGATQVWAVASPFPLSCAVRQVHPNGGGNPGGCQPNPNNTFVSGPVADFFNTGGGDPCSVSPIIIDTEGEGFRLTSPDAGVTFDIRGDGRPVQMAWTDARFHNAFLALPGADGLVHNGKELFGNFTPQPPSANPNGFLALAEYDKPENGGNGDGVIDQKDAVFSRLRLWIDENHDGICQPDELHKLSDAGIYSLALRYFRSSRTDEFGNQLRYKARVNPGDQRDRRDETANGDVGRWGYDVFFLLK